MNKLTERQRPFQIYGGNPEVVNHGGGNPANIVIIQ